MSGGELDRSLRASDAEREQTLELLRRHCADGRIDAFELDERLSHALAARTRTDLDALVADLPPAVPAAADSRPGAAAAREETGWTIAVMSGAVRRGRWRPARHMRAMAVMGGCDLDLRDAVIPSGELTITAVAVMGGVDITVPEGADVTMGGFSLMGGRDVKVREAPGLGGTPLRVHVRAFAVMGGIDVKSRRRRER